MKKNRYYRIIETPLGKTGVVWTIEDRPKITRIFLPCGNLPQMILELYPDADRRAGAKTAKELGGLINRWFAGEDWESSYSLLAQDCIYDFQKKVLAETSKIPRGKVTTYGTIAMRLASPKAARAVGTALARNPFPLIIPCHRVVRSHGSLGGFGGGLPMKQKLLEMEGVIFDLSGRVSPDCITY